jgi:adenylate cyclase
MERRLAAILIADIVGYSALMEADEAGTFARVQQRWETVLEPAVARHSGRIIKFMGDGALVEFASAVEAVQCALEVQAGFAGADQAEEGWARLALRIGVNLGDVIVSGGDRHGEGVNLAARLQALAEPGGISISDIVHRQVKGRVAVEFEDLGEQSLKNLSQPVRVFHAGAGPARAPSAASGTAKARASIAVLPFENLSGDPEQAYFSDGVTEDILTELSRFRNLFVVARNSSFQFRGHTVEMKELGRQLGVHYAVTGSVRKAGNRVRIAVQLVETESGSHLWAERYDRDIEDIFAIQDELSRTIASTLGGRIEVAAKAASRRLSTSDLRAYDLYLQAIVAQDQNTPEGYRQARRLLEQAIALEPDFAAAHLHLSLVNYVDWISYWTTERKSTFAAANELARRALALDGSNSSAHAHLGMLLMHAGEYEQAERLFEKALALNINDSKSMGLDGFFLTSLGRTDDAFAVFDQAARFNPHQPDWICWMKGIALFTARRYAEAVRLLGAINEPMNEVRGWLAASHAHLGDVARARNELDAFLRLAECEMIDPPARSLEAWTPYWRCAIPYRDEASLRHVLEGLRMAGMPA